jgi:hypothetical protein
VRIAQTNLQSTIRGRARQQDRIQQRLIGRIWINHALTNSMVKSYKSQGIDHCSALKLIRILKTSNNQTIPSIFPYPRISFRGGK